MPQISPQRFDGARAWATLTSKTQAAIGAAALELVAAQALAEAHEGLVARAADEAGRIAGHALDQAAYDEIEPLLESDAGHVHLPSCVGLVCHQCGCSHHDPCDEGCGWHDAITCTACA